MKTGNEKTYGQMVIQILEEQLKEAKAALPPRPIDVKLQRRLAKMSLDELEVEVKKTKLEVIRCKKKLNKNLLAAGLQPIQI